MINNSPKDLDLSACIVSDDGGNTVQTLSEMVTEVKKNTSDIATASQNVTAAKQAADNVNIQLNNGIYLTKELYTKPGGIMRLDENRSTVFPSNGSGDVYVSGGQKLNDDGSPEIDPTINRIIHNDYVLGKIIVQDISLSYDGVSANKQFWGTTYNPSNVNYSDLGTSNLPWRDLFVSNSPVVTSDINSKTVVTDNIDKDEEHLKLLNVVYGVSTKLYKLNTVIAEKGMDKARLHSGFIAQELQKALQDRGLDPRKYAFWIESPEYDYKEVDSGQKDPQGNPILFKEYFLKKDENGNQVYTQSLRYEELFSLLAEAFKQKLLQFEERLTKLENK